MASAATEQSLKVRMARAASGGLATDVEQAIREFDAACETVSECVARLVTLQGERPRQKTNALVRLCTQPHPVTGKAYSVSQAEDVLQLDEAYAAFKARTAALEAAVREAGDARESARMVVDLRIAEFKQAGGLR